MGKDNNMWNVTETDTWVELIDMFKREHIISMKHITMISKDKNHNRIIYVTSCNEPVIITDSEWVKLNLFSKS